MTFVKLFTLSLVLFLVACGQPDTPAIQHDIQAVHISDSEECHLCGMVINRFHGPKGQMHTKQSQQTFNFCSTNDLFAFLLQPENQHNAQMVFVHDMASSSWDKPLEANFIDAKTAWYVAGHKLKGAMGPTLASFKTKEAATQFSQEQGGKVLAFNDITLDTLTQMAKSAMDMSGHHH